MRTLKAGARRMLEGVIQAGSDGLHRANLADYAGMQAGSGTLGNYLSILRKRGLIREEGKRIIANEMLL